MKRTVIDCDRCGKENKQAGTINVYIRHQMNGAGASESVWETVDLCPACMRDELNRLMSGKNNVQGFPQSGAEWLKQVKRSTKCK